MMTSQPLFDLSFIEQMDDHNFTTEVITLYLQDTPADLDEMESALDAGSLEMVHRAAHKLKSSTGMLQANRLYVVLEQTEQIAKAGRKNGELGKLVEKAQTEFAALKTGLLNYLTELKATA